MKDIYNHIIESISKGKKLLAVLIDPDKMATENVADFIRKVNTSIATHIFVGGSLVKEYQTQLIVEEIKKYTILPVVIFPGDVSQISRNADALLFLSLISGRNPDYLIGKHVDAVAKLKNSDLEIIPTGYLLIENGKETSVQKVTKTLPLNRNDSSKIVNTARAGELLGMKLIYLEAGSGATHAVNSEIISKVKQNIQIPLIVGGGIQNIEQLELVYNSGADLVVIGTALEKDTSLFNDLIQQKSFEWIK
jgi:putative glycerol-1-phosphate prenyltransferase